jgi:hypothetical protein
MFVIETRNSKGQTTRFLSDTRTIKAQCTRLEFRGYTIQSVKVNLEKLPKVRSLKEKDR